MDNLNKTGSPEQTPESIEKKDEQLVSGKLKEGAVTTESKEELPVFKLHFSTEGIVFIKAPDVQAANEKLKSLNLGDYLQTDHITFLEQIPYAQYKDFKVEIIDN